MSRNFQSLWCCTIAENDTAAARASRHAFTALMEATASEGSDVYGATMIFGELLANAFEHGRGKIIVELHSEGADALLVFGDEGPGFVAPRSTQSADGLRGRGLHIIKSLAREVNIDTPPRSRVTVRLPVRLKHAT